MLLESVLEPGESPTFLVALVSETDSPTSSWNKRLARERAAFMFQEFRAKGANIALGPGEFDLAVRGQLQ